MSIKFISQISLFEVMQTFPEILFKFTIQSTIWSQLKFQLWHSFSRLMTFWIQTLFYNFVSICHSLSLHSPPSRFKFHRKIRRSRETLVIRHPLRVRGFCLRFALDWIFGTIHPYTHILPYLLYGACMAFVCTPQIIVCASENHNANRIASKASIFELNPKWICILRGNFCYLWSSTKGFVVNTIRNREQLEIIF